MDLWPGAIKICGRHLSMALCHNDIPCTRNEVRRGGCMNLRTRTRREGDVQKLESSADLETIHKGRPQNFRDF